MSFTSNFLGVDVSNSADKSTEHPYSHFRTTRQLRRPRPHYLEGASAQNERIDSPNTSIDDLTHSTRRSTGWQLFTRALIRLDFFAIQPEFSGLIVARATNDHIEQSNAVLFAKDSIHGACDYLIAVAATKLHELPVLQHACQ